MFLDYFWFLVYSQPSLVSGPLHVLPIPLQPTNPKTLQMEGLSLEVD